MVVFSDFFDDVDKILEGLREFRYKKHDMIVFHVMDPDELYFPLQRLTLFEDLEVLDRKCIANPRALRNAYLKEVRTFVNHLKSACLGNRIDYVQITTDQHLDVALSAYLATRANRMRA